MAILPTLLLCIVVPCTVWYCQSLFANYRKAQQSGYPILVCPTNPTNILWIILSVALRPILARYLPASVFDRIKAAIYGWEFLCKYELFARLGPSFMLVNPGKNELWVTDPDMAHEILSHRNDFLQMDIASRIMGIFGPNLITADGDDWKRQRKIVAPLLNERISESVWTESSTQAREMLQNLMGETEKTNERHPGKITGETNATIQGCRSIAINVLGWVGYGTQTSWGQESTSAPPGYQLSYMDSIIAVVQNIVPAAFIPARILTSPVMPRAVQQIGYAVTEFPGHVKDLLEVERKSMGSGKANLMSTLVRVSDTGSNDKILNSTNKLFLTEDELVGNLFQFTIAGFDTTANTMAYAIALLAAYPEWQEWICEELDEKLCYKGSLEYEKTYPTLKRCLALMFEVLRLYTPVAHIARATKSAQHITTGSGSYQVPADTTIYISAACMHVSPKIWGADALSFRPTRWLSEQGSMIHPPRSTFLPWSGGPRICPGQKMAEVEFVAVMMTIFSSYKLTPVVQPGETMEIARERLKDLMADSQPRITLQMNRPKDVKLRWERRKTS